MSDHPSGSPEVCLYCGQTQPQTFHYRRGVSVGEKILAQCAGDERKRLAWIKFLAAYCATAVAAPMEVCDYLRATLETVEKLDK